MDHDLVDISLDERFEMILLYRNGVAGGIGRIDKDLQGAGSLGCVCGGGGGEEGRGEKNSGIPGDSGPPPEGRREGIILMKSPDELSSIMWN